MKWSKVMGQQIVDKIFKGGLVIRKYMHISHGMMHPASQCDDQQTGRSTRYQRCENSLENNGVVCVADVAMQIIRVPVAIHLKMLLIVNVNQTYYVDNTNIGQ